MDERRLELKVGALALVALGVGVALVVVLTGALTGERTRLHADFGYAGGLPEGALVKFAGVKVGRISAVEFRPEARDAEGRSVPVRLAIDIAPEAARALRADAPPVPPSRRPGSSRHHRGGAVLARQEQTRSAPAGRKGRRRGRAAARYPACPHPRLPRHGRGRRAPVEQARRPVRLRRAGG